MELVTNGMRLLMVNRNRIQPIAGLGANQLQWCAANLKGFAWPAVQRLADHERASAAKEVG